MSEGVNFMDGFIVEALANIHTAMPCTVESYNSSAGTANVVPIFKRKFKGEAPQLLPKLVDVPVTKRKYKENDVVKVENTFYEPGDIVLVVFAERALDGIGGRMHSLEDGVIVGLLG